MDIVTAPPKSQQVADFIAESIATGKMQPGNRMVSTRDLAERFKVSKQVIQSAFKILSEKGLIETFVGKGTFVAKPCDAKLKTAVLALDGTTDSHATLPQALLSFFQERGYISNIFDLYLENSSSAHKSFKDLLATQPDVLVIDAFSLFPFELLDSVSKETQLIFVKRFEGNKTYNASYILEDFEYGGYLMAKEALRHDIRRLVMFSFERKVGWTSDRSARGVEKACVELGFKDFIYQNIEKLTDDEIVSCFSGRRKGQRDAVLAFPLFIGIRMFKLFADKLRIPGDLIAIGYNDTPWADAYNLTAIREPVEEIVENLAKILGTQEKLDIELKPSIVFRDSCRDIGVVGASGA